MNKKSLFFVFILTFLDKSLAQALVLEDLIKKGALEQTLSGKKIGYYIGSFDPLHLGHEAVVRKILDQGLCDYILLYPAWGGDEYKNRTDIKVRIEMLMSPFKGHPKIIVTALNPADLQEALMQEVEFLIAGKSSVQSRIPGTEYIGVIGSDVALNTSKDLKKLSLFMKGIKIPEKYREHTIGGIIGIPVQSFIVSLRVGDSIEALNGQFGDRPIQTIQTEHADNSSTKVKVAVKNGVKLDGLVNPGVQEVISRYKLYQDQH